MLIRAYGLYWNPNNVDWGNRGPGNAGSLPGYYTEERKRCQVDAWEQKGIYALHERFQVVYIGKVVGQSMGIRIRQHLTDRLAGRWDTFSWFGVNAFTKNGKIRSFNKKPFSFDNIVNSLEAISLLLLDPPLNRRLEKFTDAKIIEQEIEEWDPTEKMLNDIKRKVKSIEDELKLINKNLES